MPRILYALLTPVIALCSLTAVTHAWDLPTAYTLVDLGANVSIAQITDDNEVLGTRYSPAPQVTGILYPTPHLLPPLSTGTDVNALARFRDLTVGYSYPTPLSPNAVAVLWTKTGTVQQLLDASPTIRSANANSINRQWIGGNCYETSTNIVWACLWPLRAGVPGAPLLLPTLGGPWGNISTISAQGSVIGGTSQTATATNHATLWRKVGTTFVAQDIDTFGSTYSYGRAVSASGTRAIGSVHVGNDSQAFVWSAQSGMQVLPRLPSPVPFGNTVVSALRGESWTTLAVVGASEDYRFDGAVSTAAVWTFTPQGVPVVHNLQALVTQPGVMLEYAVAINRQGWIGVQGFALEEGTRWRRHAFVLIPQHQVAHNEPGDDDGQEPDDD